VRRPRLRAGHARSNPLRIGPLCGNVDEALGTPPLGISSRCGSTASLTWGLVAQRTDLT